MKIMLITPAPRQSRAGNRATATRWAGMLRSLGHRVELRGDYDGSAPKAMIALHAWRSAEAIHAFAARHPERPLIVALTGTDIYRFQHSHPETTLASMHRAHALIALHERAADDLPAALRSRLAIVLQSARPLKRRYPPLKRSFEICVVGHLREEKDSLRAAHALREVPAASRLRLVQLGRAHDERWAEAARAEMAINPRMRWRGEVPRGEIRRIMARARLMVMSSLMEGGANVVSEACVAGLPVIASDIAGNRGLLGDDYAGYYPPGDTAALRERLLEAERDPAFLERLRRQCTARASRFTPERERHALAGALEQALERAWGTQGALTP